MMEMSKAEEKNEEYNTNTTHEIKDQQNYVTRFISVVSIAQTNNSNIKHST